MLSLPPTNKQTLCTDLIFDNEMYENNSKIKIVNLFYYNVFDKLSSK